MPTSTFNIVASVKDQYVSKENSGVYPPTSTLNRDISGTNLILWRHKSPGSAYYLSNILLAFDTSSLPDNASVSEAVLRMYLISRQDTDGLSVLLEWYAWDGTSATDYSASPASTAHAGTTLASLTTTSDNDFSLTSTTNISKTGTTYLRMHMSQRPSDAAPTGQNELDFASYDHTTLAEPRLIVTYSTDVGGDLVGMVGI